ncbi:MAG: hypothetical protein ACLP22_19615 [Solirubrobacteraceae bacterium]
MVPGVGVATGDQADPFQLSAKGWTVLLRPTSMHAVAEAHDKLEISVSAGSAMAML